LLGLRNQSADHAASIDSRSGEPLNERSAKQLKRLMKALAASAITRSGMIEHALMVAGCLVEWLLPLF
jgi:hypothetical protein